MAEKTFYGFIVVLVLSIFTLFSPEVSSHSDIFYDYNENSFIPQQEDIADFTDGRSTRLGFRPNFNDRPYFRKEKKMCNIGGGLSGPCNNNDAITASKSHRFLSSPDSPGRRRRYAPHFTQLT